MTIKSKDLGLRGPRLEVHLCYAQPCHASVSPPVKWVSVNCLLGHVQLFLTPWVVACQASLSMGFSRQEHWSGLPFPSPGDLPDSGIKPVCPRFPALAGEFFFLTTEPPMKVRVTQSCPTLCDPMDFSPWNSPGQNTGVGSLSLLQGIFPTQGLNPGLLHCRQIFYCLSHKGSQSQKNAKYI